MLPAHLCDPSRSLFVFVAGEKELPPLFLKSHLSGIQESRENLCALLFTLNKWMLDTKNDDICHPKFATWHKVYSELKDHSGHKKIADARKAFQSPLLFQKAGDKNYMKDALLEQQK